MIVRPLGKFVVIRLLPEKPPSGAVQVVRLEKRPSGIGEVLSVGPHVRDVKPGMTVLVSRLQGMVIEIGEPLLVVPESAILGYL